MSELIDIVSGFFTLETVAAILAIFLGLRFVYRLMVERVEFMLSTKSLMLVLANRLEPDLPLEVRNEALIAACTEGINPSGFTSFDLPEISSVASENNHQVLRWLERTLRTRTGYVSSMAIPLFVQNQLWFLGFERSFLGNEDTAISDEWKWCWAAILVAYDEGSEHARELRRNLEQISLLKVRESGPDDYTLFARETAAELGLSEQISEKLDELKTQDW